MLCKICYITFTSNMTLRETKAAQAVLPSLPAQKPVMRWSVARRAAAADTESAPVCIDDMSLPVLGGL